MGISIAGVLLKNPTILASGIMGISASSLQYAEGGGAGAVTLKSIGPSARTGHPNPTVFSWEHGLQNAVGLSNPGIDDAISIIQKMVKTVTIPVFGSMFADTIDNFKMVGEKLSATGVAAIEINLSCPNTENDFGQMFALNPNMTYDVVKVVKSVVGKIPIFAKLSAESHNISEIAKAAEAAGADGISAINTVSGMIIDIHAKRPILANKVGGLSGPAIRPIGIRAVHNIYKSVKIPIIGMGGINTGEDAIEYIMAGSTAIAIGSGVYYRGITVFKKIVDEMDEFMKKENYTNLEAIRSVANTI
ncbi:dihydroorotate dehydrogenase [soil metagenome]